MNTTLTIAGTSYDATQRPGAAIELNELSRSIDGYDELSFCLHGMPPSPDFHNGAAVTLTIDGTLRFKGEIIQVQEQPTPQGWSHGYNCQGLRFQADRVPVTAVDGTGTIVLNRNPEDPYYVASDAGLSVGTIVRRVLTNTDTAARLNALGVGGYTTLSPPTLPASTLADLALLTVVPAQPVVLAGECLLNILTQLVERWHPKFVLELRPDGVIRLKDTTSTSVFVPATVTLPGPGGIGDAGACWPTVTKDTSGCASRIVLRGGPEVEAAMLTVLDGTLVAGWSGSDQSAWTLLDFTQPKGASDVGTISGVTANSCTYHSNDAAFSFGTNFWNGRQGWIYLQDSIATGINVQQARRITSNTALSTGGTCTITWDASWPIDSTNYNKARLVGAAGSRNDVGRLYLVREPGSGATGTATFVGAHLVPRSAKVIQWANNTKSFGVVAPTGTVTGGTAAVTLPLGMEVVPSLGGFRFTQPTPTLFAQPSTLNTGWPTTTSGGLPTDVQILALFSRGALSVTVPADVGGVPQYQGTSFTAEGMQVTKYLDYPNWLWKQDLTSMTTLATEHMAAIRDVVYEGTGTFLVPPSWSFLDFTTAINYAIAGTTSPWSAINAPIRWVKLAWNTQPTGSKWTVSVGFSTRRRPFTGDDLYLHPAFAGLSVLGSMGGGAAGNLDWAYSQGMVGDMTQSGYGMGPSQMPGFKGVESPGSFMDAAPGMAAPTSPMAFTGMQQPGVESIPTSMADLGVPTSMGQFGLPTSMADLGIPTSPADLGIAMPGAMPAGNNLATRADRERMAGDEQAHHVAAVDRAREASEDRIGRELTAQGIEGENAPDRFGVTPRQREVEAREYTEQQRRVEMDRENLARKGQTPETGSPRIETTSREEAHEQDRERRAEIDRKRHAEELAENE